MKMADYITDRDIGDENTGSFAKAASPKIVGVDKPAPVSMASPQLPTGFGRFTQFDDSDGQDDPGQSLIS